jgi:hypothetical protein
VRGLATEGTAVNVNDASRSTALDRGGEPSTGDR